MNLTLQQPAWLWLLPLVVAWLVFLERRTRRGSAWASLVDARLLPHLLVEPAATRRRALPLTLAGLATCSAVLALAGPVLVWQGHPVYLIPALLLVAALPAAAAFRRGWLG
ncbi:MAG TPA: hypothetical protein ENN42_08485 [Thioalkalivibrio sp.]|nr:hypothetical protein [Thioalkalivibrio sp.]